MSTPAAPEAVPTPAPRGPYRVVVVDDHAMFRTGVKAEIGTAVQVVGEAADAGSAIATVLRTAPDVVLLDVHLPGGGGIEVLRKVHEKNPDQRFLALSVSDAAEDVIGLIRAGARGYVTKSISGKELIDAIRRVAEGDAVFSPRLAGFVLDAFSGAIDLASHRRGPRPAVGPRTRGAAADRPRLRVQGSGPGALHLDQDSGDPREQRAPQTATIEPAPAHPLGHRPAARLVSFHGTRPPRERNRRT